MSAVLYKLTKLARGEGKENGGTAVAAKCSSKEFRGSSRMKKKLNPSSICFCVAFWWWWLEITLPVEILSFRMVAKFIVMRCHITIGFSLDNRFIAFI